MNIDMHVHTKHSYESPTELEDYLKKAVELRAEGFVLHGIAVTEHGHIREDESYRDLSERYGVLVLVGVEDYTREGEMLVYGLDKAAWREMTNSLERVSRTSHDYFERYVQAVTLHGGIVVPAHPFRFHSFHSGSSRRMDRLQEFEGIWVFEELNGLNPDSCNRSVSELIARNPGYYGIGGSDAHYARELARCYTEFDDEISSNSELVAALKSGRYSARALADALRSTRSSPPNQLAAGS